MHNTPTRAAVRLAAEANVDPRTAEHYLLGWKLRARSVDRLAPALERLPGLRDEHRAQLQTRVDAGIMLPKVRP